MPVSVKERQVLPMAKQPVVRLMPLPKVLEAVVVREEGGRFVVVASPILAFVPVSDVAFRFVLVAPVKNAVVALSAVAKKFVEVAFVVVASVAERFWIVLDAVEMSPPVYEFSAVHVLIEVVAGKRPRIAVRARSSVKY